MGTGQIRRPCSFTGDRWLVRAVDQHLSWCGYPGWHQRVNRSGYLESNQPDKAKFRTNLRNLIFWLWLQRQTRNAHYSVGGGGCGGKTTTGHTRCVNPFFIALLYESILKRRVSLKVGAKETRPIATDGVIIAYTRGEPCLENYDIPGTICIDGHRQAPILDA